MIRMTRVLDEGFALAVWIGVAVMWGLYAKAAMEPDAEISVGVVTVALCFTLIGAAAGGVLSSVVALLRLRGSAQGPSTSLDSYSAMKVPLGLFFLGGAIGSAFFGSTAEVDWWLVALPACVSGFVFGVRPATGHDGELAKDPVSF